MFHAARFRLVAWNAGALLVILLALGLLVYHQFATSLYGPVDQQLYDQRDAALQRIDTYQELYDAVPVQTPSGYRILEAEPSSLKIDHSSDCPVPQPFVPCSLSAMQPTSPGGLAAAARSGTQDMRTVDFAGEPWRVLTFPVVATDGTVLGIVQIARLVNGEESSLNQLTSLLILGGFLGLALAAAVGFFLANRALVPIREAFTRQRQFTADASHELRTPLALIRANAEMLARHGESLPPEDGELVTEIITETDHLNRLVGDLLTLARADAGSVTLIRENVDLTNLVETVYEDIHLIAGSQGIETEIHTDGTINVQGDPGRLRQLVLILLDNAIKYTDAGGSVTVSLRSVDHHALLEVADTGVGIPPNDLPRIFDRFYRVDQARGHDGGTGLGLAIARWIVQAHKGDIKVDSVVGQGTRFKVELPLLSQGRTEPKPVQAIGA